MANEIYEPPPNIAVKAPPLDMEKYITLENVNLTSQLPAPASGIKTGYLIAGILLAIILFKN